MIRLLVLVLALSMASACAQVPSLVERRNVTVPANGLELRAELVLSPRRVDRPAIVALHGCGGPFAARDRQWQEILAGAGHPMLFPDSFASRGLGSQCRNPSRDVSPGRERRADTVAAARWLAQQSFTPPGGVVVLGWSNGGSTVLAAAAVGVMPPGLVRGFIAFYPGCRSYADRADWAPSAPLLILIGAEDDWTPAEPCRRLAARFPDRIKLVVYPGAYHEFDVPDMPVRTRTGLAFTAEGNGRANAGTDPAARAAAITEVMTFLESL